MSFSNEQSNPYHPPVGVEHQSTSTDQLKIGVVCFWSAVVAMVVGVVSLFLRNSPPLGWFLIAAVLFVVAMCVAENRYRVSALFGLSVCLIAGGMVTMIHLRQQRAMREQQQQNQSFNAIANALGDVAKVKPAEAQRSNASPAP